MADSTHFSAPVSVFAPILRAFSALGAALVRMGENSEPVRKIKVLQAMSDEELAARGLTRDDITRYALSGSYYL